MFNVKKLNIEDFITIIDKLGNSHSTSDSMVKFTEDPNHILLFNEMMKYSKEELEKEFPKKVFYVDLYESIIRNRSYLAFVALMQKGAFIHKLLPENQWLLENIEIKTISFYSNLNQSETTRFFNSEKEYNGYGLSYVLSYYTEYFNKLESVQLTRLAKKLYNQFGSENFDSLNYFAMDYVTCSMSKVLLTIFKENNRNINQGFMLTNDLPKENSYTKDFFINSISLISLQKRLEAGYRLDEENYSFKGKSLMENLLLFGNADVVNTILPYLTRAKPFVLNYGEQHSLLNKFKKLPNFEDIENHYFSLVEQEYDRVIPQKNFKNEKKKI